MTGRLVYADGQPVLTASLRYCGTRGLGSRSIGADWQTSMRLPLRLCLTLIRLVELFESAISCSRLASGRPARKLHYGSCRDGSSTAISTGFSSISEHENTSYCNTTRQSILFPHASMYSGPDERVLVKPANDNLSLFIKKAMNKQGLTSYPYTPAPKMQPAQTAAVLDFRNSSRASIFEMWISKTGVSTPEMASLTE